MSIGGKQLHTQPVSEPCAEKAALEGVLQGRNGYSKEPVISATELKALRYKEGAQTRVKGLLDNV